MNLGSHIVGTNWPTKGLACNAHGRWVKPRRDPEDIPSPHIQENINVHALEAGMQTQDVLKPLLSV